MKQTLDKTFDPTLLDLAVKIGSAKLLKEHNFTEVEIAGLHEISGVLNTHKNYVIGMKEGKKLSIGIYYHKYVNYSKERWEQYFDNEKNQTNIDVALLITFNLETNNVRHAISYNPHRQYIGH